MTETNVAQLRLRSAFRYGYFAFIAALAPLAVLAGCLLVAGQTALHLAQNPDTGLLGLLLAMGLGLIVPMFLAFWLLISSAVLRRSMSE